MLPSWNDSKRDLLFKIANNYYSFALDNGVTGLTPPNWNDSPTDLIRKWCYFTAVI